MRPVDPGLTRLNAQRVVYAEHQPEYKALPVLQTTEGRVVSRWRLSVRERLRVLFGADVFLEQMAFHQPLQPVFLTIDPDEVGHDD